MFDIVILTDQRYVNPERADWYTQQGVDEDGQLKTAFRKQRTKSLQERLGR